MKFYGEAHLQQNNLKEAVIPLDTAFPVSPKVGQIVFKDRILYICVEIVDFVPVWVPLTREITAYKHIQNTNSATWVVNHMLNTQHVNVMVFDDLNRAVIPDGITIVDVNRVDVSFTSACQGKVTVLTGSFDGQTMPAYAFEFLQTTPSTTWTIVHMLGRNPIVRVFIGNQEVQPSTITFDNSNQVTVTFATPQVGQAKLI